MMSALVMAFGLGAAVGALAAARGFTLAVRLLKRPTIKLKTRQDRVKARG